MQSNAFLEGFGNYLLVITLLIDGMRKFLSATQRMEEMVDQTSESGMEDRNIPHTLIQYYFQSASKIFTQAILQVKQKPTKRAYINIFLEGFGIDFLIMTLLTDYP